MSETIRDDRREDRNVRAGNLDSAAVLAVVDEQARYDDAFATAIEIAADRDLPVVFYDLTAAELKRPTDDVVAGTVSDLRTATLVDREALDVLGRDRIVEMVDAAHRRGVSAWSVLPDAHGMQALADVADELEISLVVLPRSLDDADYVELLKADTTDEALRFVPAPVVTSIAPADSGV